MSKNSEVIYIRKKERDPGELLKGAPLKYQNGICEF